MKRNKTGYDGNDQSYDEQPSQYLFQSQQQALLLQGSIQRRSGHLNRLFIAMSLQQSAVERL